MLRLTSLALVLGLTMAVAAPGAGAPSGRAGQALTLAQLEEMAATRHPAVREADSRRQALESRAREARATHWPEFQASYYYNTNPIFAETEKGFSSIQHHGDFGLYFPVLKRLGLAPGEEEKFTCRAKAAEQERLRAVHLALWQVRELFVDIWEGERREKDYRELLRLLEEARKLAAAGLRERELLPAELLALEQQVVDVRENLSLAARSREARLTRLANLLSLPPGSFTLAPHTVSTRTIPPFPALLKLAQEARPDLGRTRWNIRAAQVDGERAPFKYLDVGLEARYNFDHYKVLGTRSGALLGVRFSAPLTIFSLVKHRREAALREAEALAAAGEGLSRTVESEVLTALEKLQTLEVRLKVMQQQIRVAEEGVRTQSVLVSQPSLQASASPLELLAVRYQAGSLRREAGALEAEREKAYYHLLYAVGVQTLGETPEGRPPSGPAARSNPGHPPLAIWVYHPDRLLREKKTGELLDLAKTRGIKRFFLCLDNHLMRRLNRYGPELAQFLVDAGRQGVAVEALMDEPTWLLPATRHQLGDYLKAIQDFHAQAPPGARFQAIHLDLEINQLPDWQARKDEVARYLLDTLRYVKSREPSLPLVVDLPVWLERQGIRLWPDIIRAADRVVFMAYEQKTPDHLVRALHPLLAFCQQERKPVWIGLNLQDFVGQGEGALERYMSEVDRKISPRVAGFALFQYQDLQRLRLAKVSP